MNKTATKIAMAATLLLASGFAVPQTVSAASPTGITIQGGVYDKTSPVKGVTVVAWCGGVNFFGGSDATDVQGQYIIHTNSEDCPLGTELTVTTDVDGDGRSDGATHTQTHTATTISIHLHSYTSVAVPEYGWISGGVTTAAGAGIIGFTRWFRLKKL